MTAPVLEARSVYKTFRLGRQDIPVLRGVDLVIQRGEIVALLGASGAGKSTLLHVLGLLDPPSSGEVLYDGETVHALSVRQRARLRHAHTGFVFQFYHLIPELTALQNVLLTSMMTESVMRYWGKRREYKAAATDLMKRVGLGHRLGHRPNQLSGGERQRVAIARALLAEPRVILADEPTGNLDSHTADEVIDLMFELQRERDVAFVLVTHDEQLAARANRIVRLSDGVVVA